MLAETRMGWDGMGWDGMGWDGTGPDRTGPDRIDKTQINGAVVSIGCNGALVLRVGGFRLTDSVQCLSAGVASKNVLLQDVTCDRFQGDPSSHEGP